MTRHPGTEGNDLKPHRVDAQDDVTVPDGDGGRLSFAEAVEGITAEVDLPDETGVNKDWPEQGITKVVDESLVVDDANTTFELDTESVFEPDNGVTAIDQFEIRVYGKGLTEDDGLTIEGDIYQLDLIGVDDFASFDPVQDYDISIDGLSEIVIFEEEQNVEVQATDKLGLEIDIDANKGGNSNDGQIVVEMFANVRTNVPHVHALEVENAE